jgi:hypothetical protein
MLANAIIVVIGFNDIAIAGYLEKIKQISKHRLNVAACQQVNSPLWKTFQCTSEMLLEQYCQALLCRGILTQLRLRDATAVTKLRVQSSGRQHQKWHYRPQDGGQPKNGSPFNDKAGVLDHECSASLLLRQHGRVACTSLRSGSWAAVPETQIAVPSRKTEAGQRTAHHSERRSVYYTTSAQVSCERLDGKPGLRRRLADAEKSLPVPAKVKRDLLHNPNIP